MSPADASRLQLFLALFFMAVGFLFTLLCCGTDYWLVAAESCGGPGASGGGALSGRKTHHINTEARRVLPTPTLSHGEGVAWPAVSLIGCFMNKPLVSSDNTVVVIV